MAEAQQFETVYVTATAPVDKAGNFYTPALIPQGVDPLPANVTRVAPTADQIAAGKALKFDWASQAYVESGEDPINKALATLGVKVASSTASNAQMIAALGKQLAAVAAATKADDQPAAAPTTDNEQPKEA